MSLHTIPFLIVTNFIPCYIQRKPLGADIMKLQNHRLQITFENPSTMTTPRFNHAGFIRIRGFLSIKKTKQ